MAYAVVTFSYGVPTTTPTFIRILLDMIFFGEDVPGGREFAAAQVEVAGNASANSIKSAITTAVTALAVEQGIKLTPSSITMPTFQKG